MKIVGIVAVCVMGATLEGNTAPIDVVIPCHEKDLRTLELAIQGIKKNGKNVRRVIVVSEKKLTDLAEWFDESNYPFTKVDLLTIMFNSDQNVIDAYVHSPKNRIGWIYQQFLKLYAPLVIPDISANVLIVDSDTIFFRETEFIDHEGYALYNTDQVRVHKPYFDQARRLLSSFKQMFPKSSGITNHMLMQRHVLQKMFEEIRVIHKCEPWIALCKSIDPREFSGISEYELYFNYVFAHQDTEKVKVRQLKWQNMGFRERDMAKCQQNGFHYVTCHSYR